MKSKLFYVEYAVRNIGAVGDFWLKSDTLYAENTSQALERFRNRWQHKYEFYFPYKCYCQAEK